MAHITGEVRRPLHTVQGETSVALLLNFQRIARTRLETSLRPKDAPKQIRTTRLT